MRCEFCGAVIINTRYLPYCGQTCKSCGDKIAKIEEHIDNKLGPKLVRKINKMFE